MGLFGVFATICSGGILFAETCKNASYAANNREEARKAGRLTYGDGKGNEYLVSTGEKVYTLDGKIYSTKHYGLVLHDGWEQYYMERNERELAEAKEKGKKYALLYYLDPNGQNGYSSHYTELSTMKRFIVDKVVYLNKGNWDWGFSKKYYNGNDKYDGERITITRKEYEELGGYVPYMSPAEYQKQEMIRREKEFKKLMKGL